METLASLKGQDEIINSFLSLVIDQANKVPKQAVKIAVNCAGTAMTDSLGIDYISDGDESDNAQIGCSFTLFIGGVPMCDQPLYKTEKFKEKDISYRLPQLDNGEYVLVVKMNECCEYVPEKFRDVNIDLGHQRVASNVDLHKLVGQFHAYDVIVEFQVKNDGRCLVVNGENSDISKDFRLYIRKGERGWPRLNAFYIVKGTLRTLPIKPPQLPRYLRGETEVDKDSESYIEEKNGKTSSFIQNVNDQERLKTIAKAMVKSGMSMQVMGTCLLSRWTNEDDDSNTSTV